jgi:hypothetical protein
MSGKILSRERIIGIADHFIEGTRHHRLLLDHDAALRAENEGLRELAKNLADELGDIWDPTRHLHSRNVRVQALLSRGDQ